jgi:hypothetical protein
VVGQGRPVPVPTSACAPGGMTPTRPTRSGGAGRAPRRAGTGPSTGSSTTPGDRDGEGRPVRATLDTVSASETAPEALLEFVAELTRPPGRVVNQLGRLLREHGLNQRELARRSGVGIRAASELARG